jgi:ParB-like chromosome segregation protein Spo0J
MAKHNKVQGRTMANDKHSAPAIVTPATTAPATAAPVTTASTGAPEAITVPLTSIHVDYSWNCRAERRVQDMADTESSGFEGFGAGIRSSGQLTPVILRNTHGTTLAGTKTDKAYELVVGFRRMRAITILNEKNEAERAKAENRNNVPNLPNGHILAQVKDIPNVTAARILNGQENTQRKNLGAPDLVYLTRDLSRAGLTQTAIGEALGITQGWVSKLLQIAALPPAVVDNWRDGSPVPPVSIKEGTFGLSREDAKTQKELTEPEMRELAKLKSSPEEITARYIRLVKPAVAQGDGGGTPAPKDKVKEEICYIAGLMGCMVRAGVLDSGSLDWTRVIGPRKKGYPIDCGKDDTQGRLLELGDAASDAYEREVIKGAKGAESLPVRASN